MQILKVRFRTNTEFQEHYQEELPNGGLFCPTTSPLQVGAPVIVELSAPALPNKVLIRGAVRAWRPALPRLRVRAGATVEFDSEETEKRDFIVETISGDRGPSPRRRHTRLPVAVRVKYRAVEGGAAMEEADLTEISVGGALPSTTEPLPIDTDIILEITPPGAVSPLSISGKATYHLPNGATGLKFIYRDGGGSRRLRELVRRLRQS
jgi:Tfp pilus assembly protein PilZ